MVQLSTNEAAKLAGLTFRQLDYLVRQDVVQRQPPKRYNKRGWDADTIHRLQVAAALAKVSGNLGGRPFSQLPAIMRAVNASFEPVPARFVGLSDGQVYYMDSAVSVAAFASIGGIVAPMPTLWKEET